MKHQLVQSKVVNQKHPMRSHKFMEHQLVHIKLVHQELHEEVDEKAATSVRILWMSPQIAYTSVVESKSSHGFGADLKLRVVLVDGNNAEQNAFIRRLWITTGNSIWNVSPWAVSYTHLTLPTKRIV